MGHGAPRARTAREISAHEGTWRIHWKDMWAAARSSDHEGSVGAQIQEGCGRERAECGHDADMGAEERHLAHHRAGHLGTTRRGEGTLDRPTGSNQKEQRRGTRGLHMGGCDALSGGTLWELARPTNPYVAEGCSATSSLFIGDTRQSEKRRPKGISKVSTGWE